MGQEAQGHSEVRGQSKHGPQMLSCVRGGFSLSAHSPHLEGVEPGPHWGHPESRHMSFLPCVVCPLLTAVPSPPQGLPPQLSFSPCITNCSSLLGHSPRHQTRFSFFLSPVPSSSLFPMALRHFTSPIVTKILKSLMYCCLQTLFSYSQFDPLS